MSQPLDLRSLATSGDPAPAKERELVSRTHEFEVAYTSPEGVRYRDTLTSRIMDGDERITVSRIAARRADVQWEQLPKAQAARIWAQSVLAIQLRDPPEWVSRWAVEDDALLFALFDVASMHETEFFRDGAGEGSEDSGASRVSVSTTLAASTTGERA